MDLTNQRRLLTTLAAGFAALAIGGVVWSVSSLSPGSLDETSHAGGTLIDTASGLADSTETSTETDTTDSESVTDLSMPLLKPLYEAPKPPPQPVQPVVRKPLTPVVKEPRLDWSLDGTIIDPARSIAILTDASGKTDLRGVGEEVELSPAGVLVRKIESDQVTLEVRGKKSTLRLQQSFSAGGGANNDRPNRRRNR